MTRKLALSLVSCVAMFGTAHGQGDPQSLIERGEYVARAADCLSCHIAPDGTPYAGGKFIGTPLGAIMGTNITPSGAHGIGDYSEEDFAAALREGKATDRMLYPAMPYEAYHNMTDDDLSALYAYMMSLDPVERSPQGETDLDFPFNMRFLMRFWNAIALEEVEARPEDETLARGQYLVDTLGHCSACHTPRNALMMEDEDRYFAGAEIHGWLAPNITSDEMAGLGRWQVGDIATYLKTGRAMNAAQASGPMAEVVHFSTRHMDRDDLEAMAAYLKTVPAIATPGQTQPVLVPESERADVGFAYGTIREELGVALARDDLDVGERLYLTHCAACHGVGGQGQTAAYYPALEASTSVRMADPNTLIMVIAKGVKHPTLYRAPLMPGFERDLAHDEITQIANYVRAEFGGMADSDLSAEDIDGTLNGGPELPFLIKYAAVFAWLGIALAVLAVAALGWFIWRRRSEKRKTA